MLRFMLLGVFLLALCGFTSEKTPEPIKVPGKYSVQDIENLAVGSRCAAYKFKERGKAPISFLKGINITFARQLCNPAKSSVAYASKAPGGSGDALVRYGLESKAGENTLKNLYGLMIGLSMRESAGQYCTGRDEDPRAKFVEHDQAEAGLLQTSYNVIRASTEASKLYAEYKRDRSKCYLDTYKIGVSCRASDAKNWGVGEGTIYQELAKACPSFAVESAAIILRFSGGASSHYGPIRTKAAEFKQECVDMLSAVQKMIGEDPSLCEKL